MFNKRAWSSLLMLDFDVRRDMAIRRAARAAGVPNAGVVRQKRPGRLSLEEERAQFLAQTQSGSRLIRREDVVEAAPERPEIEKTWVPPSPRAYRSERPGVVAKSAGTDAKISSAAEFDALWLAPEELVRRKVVALAAHFNGGK